MRQLSIFAILFWGPISWAAVDSQGRLACWNIFASKGAKPILTAEYRNSQVVSIKLNSADSFFDEYNHEKTEYSEHWKSEGKKQSRVHSQISELEMREITAKNSPYEGLLRYDFSLGRYSYKSDWYNKAGEYSARLVISKDLSPDFLKTFRIRHAKERSNAVVIMEPPFLGGQNGDNYLRLYCVSK